MLEEKLQKIRQIAKDAINSVESSEQLEALRIRFLGKKGEITALLSEMGKLSAEERPKIGQAANEARNKIDM